MIDLIVGARPNFVKSAALLPALKARGADVRLVHTGQHADVRMSDALFRDLGLPEPDVRLHGDGSTVARVYDAYRAVLTDAAHPTPDAVIVTGDVDSTLACALAARRHDVPVAHVEAGLRCGDMTMPEEVNRRLTDAVADVLFASEPQAVLNLEREAVPGAVHHVGNVMIDTLARTNGADERLLFDPPYVLVTLHRPANVDDPDRSRAICAALADLAVPMVFPMHPRTRKAWEAAGLWALSYKPLPYGPFIHQLRHAAVVITDSGGVQEEATYLGVPCITVRPSTERPVTVKYGTNVLAEPHQVPALVDDALVGNWKTGRVPELWDGHAAERIAEILVT